MAELIDLSTECLRRLKWQGYVSYDDRVKYMMIDVFQGWIRSIKDNAKDATKSASIAHTLNRSPDTLKAGGDDLESIPKTGKWIGKTQIDQLFSKMLQ